MPSEQQQPNWTYFRACEGRWAGRLDLRITDWAAFRATPMPLFDRLGLLSLAYATRLLGAFRLETSVDASSAAARGEVVHTTRVAKWGMTLMRSVDTLRLDANGRDMTMSIAMALGPMPWRTRVTPPAPAAVDADGRGARYRFPWFGTEMRQRGELSADGETVTLTQETAFSHGVQILHRR